MRFIISALFVHIVTFTLGAPVLKDEESAMKIMLDAMQQMMTAEDNFDEIYYDKLRNCMDDTVKLSQDHAWQGMIDYWDTEKSETDPWGSWETKYMENCETDHINVQDMVIHEPCNYASNVAYYHAVTEICDRKLNHGFSIRDADVEALLRGFSIMSFASAFMHGSHTELGHQQDASSIKILSFAMHQASVSALPDSTVIHDLSNFSVPSGIELIDDFTNTYANLPVGEWYAHVASLEMPGYYRVFAAIITTAMTLVFEEDVIIEVAPKLLDIFGVSQEDQDFILKQYIPELTEATENLSVKPIEEIKFLGNGIGTVTKLLYSLLWQEEVFDNVELFLLPSVNKLAWKFLPVLNVRAGQFETFRYYEPEFQLAIDTYPGDTTCNPVYPHAKWHLESGIGMLDLAYLSNEIHRIIELYN